MKKKLLLLSMLLAFATISPIQIHADSDDIDQLEQQVKSDFRKYQSSLLKLHAKRSEDYFKVGEPIAFDNDTIVTIESIETEIPDIYYEDEVTGTMVKVTVTIDNQSSDRWKITGHDFSMYDGDRLASELLAKDFFSVEVEPGMKAEGTMYYNVKNLGDLTLFLGKVKWSAKL